MGFQYPDPRLLQQAQQQNPTQAAAAGLTQAQGQQAPGRPGNGPYGPDPSNAGFASQVGSNTSRSGSDPNATPTSGQVNPSQFGTSSYANGSNQWYGKNNEYGSTAMVDNPSLFWGGYGEDVMGLAPGSNASTFLASKYNPFAIGSAMYGKGFVSDEQKLAGGTSIANQIAGPGTTFFNPGVLIQNTLQALASGNIEQLAKQNPTLAALVPTGNPIAQVSQLATFFKDLLSATMSPDTLNAFIDQITSLGQMWFSQMRKDPNVSAMDSGGTFAKFLMNTLGPTLGL